MCGSGFSRKAVESYFMGYFDGFLGSGELV